MKFIIRYLLPLLLLSASAQAEIVVIVNPAVGAVSQDDVQRIFLGKKSSFEDGSTATPYYLPESSAERTVFDQKALGRSPAQLKAYWAQLVFTGKGKAPAELASSAAAKEKVATDKSAIAYVDSSVVDSSVKVVATY